MRLRVVVLLREPVTIEKQSAGQPTQQVTQQVKRLLGCLKGEMSRSELMQSVKLKDRVSFEKNYLEPALSDGLIEMTQPDWPRSPMQKYRLTEKGRQLVNKEQ